jgi:putative ABC transport system substrate-binding protein
MRRRDFIAVTCFLAAAPRAALAQRRARPVIGFISVARAQSFELFVAEFRGGLQEAGYVDGDNVAIEYRWAEGRYERMPGFAIEMVRRGVDLIIASGGNVSVMAAKAATSTIPIVFTATADPVESGIVASLGRPGGNVTGIGTLTAELDAKRLELLGELLPGLDVIGALVNQNRPDIERQIAGIESGARALGQRVSVRRAGDGAELEAAFEGFAADQVRALLVGADPYFSSERARVVALAARHRIAAIYQWREYVEAGGLMSYGPSLGSIYRQAGIYAGRILKGAKPGDLPVQQPTRFDLLINAKAAKAIGLVIPQPLLDRADEVFE